MSKSVLLTSPLNFYNKYKTYSSPHIEFPEFKILVDNINKKLNDDTLFTVEFNNEKKLLLQELYFLKDLYYDDVIRFCSKFVDTIDLIFRKKTGQTYPDYFHRKRYFYYMEYCITKFPEIILFPTFDNIGATDLIKTRCVPVFFVGISTEPAYADEFILTPNEFFFHDINHGRIIYQQDEAYIKEKNMKKEDLILVMEKSIIDYYTLIKTIKDKKIAALMKMLIFEIIHEDGFPFVFDKLCERLVRAEGPDKVERMNGDVIELVEKTTASTIGTALYKLRCGFYDKENEPLSVIVDTDYRTSDKIVEATDLLLKMLNCPPKSSEEIYKLIKENSSIVPIRKCLNGSPLDRKTKSKSKSKSKSAERTASK